MNRALRISFLVLIAGGRLLGTAVAQSNTDSTARDNPFDYLRVLPRLTSTDSSRTPDGAVTCYDAGMAKLRNEDPAGALVEFERLIAIQPYAIKAYVARSQAKEVLRDYPGAIADESRAIELNRDDPTSYQRRGVSEMLARRWTDAQNDLRKASEKPETTDPYAPIFLWLTCVRLDQKAAADRDLAAFVDARPEFGAPMGWVQHIGRFLLGREMESDFLDAASAEEASAIERLVGPQQSPSGSTQPSRFKVPSRIGYRCEAMFYCGVMKRLAGDKAAAAEQFRQCLATKRTRFSEYYLAAEELRELEQ